MIDWLTVDWLIRHREGIMIQLVHCTTSSLKVHYIKITCIDRLYAWSAPKKQKTRTSRHVLRSTKYTLAILIIVQYYSINIKSLTSLAGWCCSTVVIMFSVGKETTNKPSTAIHAIWCWRERECYAYHTPLKYNERMFVRRVPLQQALFKSNQLALCSYPEKSGHNCCVTYVYSSVVQPFCGDRLCDVCDKLPWKLCSNFQIGNCVS